MYIAPGEKDEKTSTTTQIIKDSVKIKKSKNKLSPVDSSKEDDKNKILENIDLFTHSQSHYMPKGYICNAPADKRPKELYSCKNKKKVLFFSSRFPLENELEGANREVLQYVEILAALGHDIRFVSFSSKVPEFAAELRTARGAIDREKYDFLMGSFNMSGVSLLERTERLRVSQPPVNGKLPFVTVRAIRKILLSFAPDLVIMHANYRNFLHSDYIMDVTPRMLPNSRIMTFLDESLMSPIEWLPRYLAVSNATAPDRDEGPDTVMEYQKSIMTILEDKLVKGSDMALTETKARVGIINGRNIEHADIALLRVMRLMNTPYQVLHHVKMSSHIMKKEGYHAFMSRRGDLSIVQPEQRPIPEYSSRNKILFLGTGNCELDFHALMWFDRNLVFYLRNGISNPKVDVMGENWYRVKHELEHQDLYTFGLDAKAINIEDLHNELDKYLVAIFPMNTNTIGRNPYVAAALERGLPIVLTVNSAEGMCEDCRDMVTRNPMDPFDSSPKHFPFLVSNVNEDYSFVERIKRVNYDAAEWKKFSQLGVQHALQSKWFSRYEGAIDLDGFIRDIFAKPKKKLVKRAAVESTPTQDGNLSKGNMRRSRQGKKVGRSKK